MTITKKLQTEFPGITAMIAGVIDALRAYRAYNRALKDIEVLKMKDSVNGWAWNVSEHSELLYTDALDIYDFLSAHPYICKYTQNMITEFVIEIANRGHTGDMILKYLVETDIELDRWAREKLNMR